MSLIKKLDFNENKVNGIFLSLIGLIFIGLLIRNCGLYPMVFGDEFLHSQLSRLMPFSESNAPEYLYLAVYRLTNICGDGFLNCARIFNALFFCLSAPFIYLIAKKVTGVKTAAMITLLVLLGPINSITIYYMPESLYFFSFWFFVWFLLRLDCSSSFGSWVLAGILFGAITLVKPHALIFAPAIMLYIICVLSKKRSILFVAVNTVFFIISGFVIKFSISYLFAGRSGMNFIGGKYASGSSILTNLSYKQFIELILMSGHSIIGYFLSLCLMYGLPLALIIYIAIKAIFSRKEVVISQRVAMLAFFILTNLILALGLFLAEHDLVERLSMRHCNFSFPLFLIISASQLYLKPSSDKRKWRIIIGLMISAPLLYAIYTHMHSYSPNFVDCPELYFFTSHGPVIFYTLGMLSFFSLILWIYSAKMGVKFFLYIFVPITICLSVFYFSKVLLKSHAVPVVCDKAGIFVRQYLAPEDFSKILVIGSDEGELSRVLFHLNNAQASMEIIPKGATYNLSKLTSGKKWILAIGEYRLSDDKFFQLSSVNGFTLVRVR